MANDKPERYKASLRIHSDVLSAEQISELLNMQPDGFNVKGTKAVPDHPKSFVYPSHMWRLESDADETEPLDQHISRLVDFIESRGDTFKKLSADCKLDMYCGFFANDWIGHVELTPDLLKRLTVIPIKVVIRLYEPTSDGS
jgi:hypothetical protein